MGSTGSGNFSDYSGSRNQGGGGGASGTDRCEQAFECSLEEVAQCAYFANHEDVPPQGTRLRVSHESGRLFAVDQNEEAVGALPTRFNYLATCLADGFEYIGIVSFSDSDPVPRVVVDFTPNNQ